MKGCWSWSLYAENNIDISKQVWRFRENRYYKLNHIYIQKKRHLLNWYDKSKKRKRLIFQVASQIADEDAHLIWNNNIKPFYLTFKDFTRRYKYLHISLTQRRKGYNDSRNIHQTNYDQKTKKKNIQMFWAGNKENVLNSTHINKW